MLVPLTMEGTHTTFEQLDWPQLCHAVADRCAGQEAREYWLDPEFFDSPYRVNQELALVQEAMELLELGEDPPFGAYHDVRIHMERVRRDGAVDGLELIQVAQTLGCARRVRSHLLNHRDEAPGLADLAQTMADLGDLEDSVLEAFEPNGELADNASEELGGLRRQVMALHQSITRRMERLVQELDANGVLQDSYFTLRQERYVVPLRAGAKGQVRGIVHDVSGSGQTLFVEPEEMVELNNRLRIAQLAVAEEQRRILARLGRWIREEFGAIVGNLEVLARVDRIFAAARLGRDLEATVVRVGEGSRVTLRRARHPLLLLKGIEVVPNDLDVTADTKVVIISGPNTGGKTVTLKMLGLFALMVRAGLPIPVDPGSRFPWFDRVFADIGDRQSIEQSLSTFSAHMVSLAGFLPLVRADSLVLLDELVVGTDPREGEALAMAILEYLADRAGLTAVTTHYERLKLLPMEDHRFENLSVGFDPETLAPTFELELGTPGRSSPLDVAARLEIPEVVLARARSHLAGEGPDLQAALRALEQAKLEVERERLRMEAERKEAEAARRAARREEAMWRAKREELLHRGRDEALTALARARQQVTDAVRALQRGRVDHELVTRVRRKLERVEVEVHRHVVDKGAQGLTMAKIREGMEVLVTRSGIKGKVQGVEPSKGRVTVVTPGGLKVTVKPGDLEALSPSQPPVRPKARPAERSGRRKAPRGRGKSKRVPVPPADELDTGAPPPNEANTCDLRGARVDEALEQVERYLDRALERSVFAVFVVHGHGTGALKKAVREFLERSPYVARWRPGTRVEGGDGVSVVWLDHEA